MKYDLIRPCPHCPFRVDGEGYLRGERAQEIARSIANGAGFACHQTTVDMEDDEGNDDRAVVAGSQMCAGAMITLEHAQAPNQLMRVAERLGLYDASKLDMESPVARSLTEFIDHHAHGEGEEIECCSVCDHNCLAPAGYMEGGVAIRNVEIDPEDMTTCSDCGEPVCTACLAESGKCPDCDECDEG